MLPASDSEGAPAKPARTQTPARLCCIIINLHNLDRDPMRHRTKPGNKWGVGGGGCWRGSYMVLGVAV